MAARAALLEEFDRSSDTSPAAADGSTRSAEDLEALRMESYDAGYRSGWEDCLKAEEDAHGRVSAELARNLQDISFTYFEVREQMLAAFEPLLLELFGRLLPGLTPSATVLHVIDEILERAAAACDAPAEIVVSTGYAGTVQRLLPPSMTMPVRIVEESSLAADQAYLRIAGTEIRFDLSDLAGRLLAAIGHLDSSSEETAAHA